VPDADAALVLRLVGGDPTAPAEVLDHAVTSPSPGLLVGAAVVSQDEAFLDQAGRSATTTRDRQLVALARAHLHGDTDLLDALVRDHLAEHPDNLLAAWIAGITSGATPDRAYADNKEQP